MKLKNEYLFRLGDIEAITPTAAIKSPVVGAVVTEYLKSLVPESAVRRSLDKYFSSPDDIHSFLIDSYFLNYEDLLERYPFVASAQNLLLKLIDGVYDAWRQTERYLICDEVTPDAHYLIAIINAFSTVIINLYRSIYEKILQHSQRVYRELASGVNGGILLSHAMVELPPQLAFLSHLHPISSLIVKPPFMVRTFSNKRTGIFKPLSFNLEADSIDLSAMQLLPLRINERLCLCYIHSDYTASLIGLGTLFEIADSDFLASHQPDLIMVYGVEGDFEPGYSRCGQLLAGLIPHQPRMDYFGYAKKMILTLYNLLAIDCGQLPIHGAGIKVILKDGTEKNVAILGDSGAGKSETIEALTKLNDPRIADIVTIFDDMGTFYLTDEGIFMSGTEVGAFVRLDDLDQSYSLRSVDRAIFYNPEKVNSRVVVPITDYQTTRERHQVDIFLCADNYSKSDKGVRILTDRDEILTLFEAGARVAMSTTSEKGLVQTFFANPFGPLQEPVKTKPLIESAVDRLLDDRKSIGVLYTYLSQDKEKGVARASVELLNLIANYS